MNGWLVFILVIIACHFLLDTLMCVLNLKALSPQLPDEFSDIFDKGKYQESQDYTKARTYLSLWENSFTTTVTLAFLLCGGFNILDQFARSFASGPIMTGILFIASLLTLSTIIGLPFSIYATFRLEARFGFNRTTVLTFVTDIVKIVVLTVIIGTPILALILWFFYNFEPYAWLYCWLGVVGFGFVMQFLSPVLIMPLFNKFTPLEEGPLKQKITSYADREQFKIGGIYTMDGSKRSAKLNAFFTGFGRYRKIVFFDTLIEKLTEDEIIAVLAHEMGHFKKSHIWKMMGAAVLHTGLMFFLLSLFMKNPGLFQAFRMDEVSIHASLVFFAILYTPLSTLISIFQNGLSRRHEFEADRYGAQTTGTPATLIQGLKKLSRENLSNLTPHPLPVCITYSHPPILQRINALKQMKI